MEVKERLSKRQVEVAELIALGMSNDEIAVQLGITPRTVRAHVDELKRKLGVKYKRQLPHVILTLNQKDGA